MDYFTETTRFDRPATDRELILRLYRQSRRNAASHARSESAAFPRSAYPERYGRRAAHALAKAKARVAAFRANPTDKRVALPSYVPSGIWRRPSHSGMASGAIFSAYGEARVFWCETPETYLRFIGLSHDVAPRRVDHRGWFTLPDGDGETVSGVVYQLPARDGRVRLLYGYADPWNCDKDGRGPALLSLSIVESDDFDDAKADAAAWGDGMAERMAEAERDHQEAFTAGQNARSLIADALEHIREARRLAIATRDACAKGAFAAGAETLRRARDAFGDAQERRADWRSAMRDAPTYDSNLKNAFREGYANA